MSTPSPSRTDRSPTVDQLAALVGRNLRTSARVPQLLMFSLTMPMAMLVLFSQVFRSVADGTRLPRQASATSTSSPRPCSPSPR